MARDDLQGPLNGIPVKIGSGVSHANKLNAVLMRHLTRFAHFTVKVAERTLGGFGIEARKATIKPRVRLNRTH
jgi:hypothetical protein